MSKEQIDEAVASIEEHLRASPFHAGINGTALAVVLGRLIGSTFPAKDHASLLLTHSFVITTEAMNAGAGKVE